MINKLIYPESFVNNIKEVFGKESLAYKLANDNDESLGSLLNNLTDDCFIPLEEIISILESDDKFRDYSLYSKAKSLLEKKQIYDEWLELFDNHFKSKFEKVTLDATEANE
jgi:hypothetical protein